MRARAPRAGAGDRHGQADADERAGALRDAAAAAGAPPAVLFPPTLVRRVVGDLAAVADAALRSGLEALDGRLQALDELCAGIEPLAEDIRAVRNSVDDLEPLLRGLRSDLAPLGELAEKIPGIGWGAARGRQVG